VIKGIASKNISEKESEDEKVINIQLHISPKKKGGKEP
jgi:hypothetical protein